MLRIFYAILRSKMAVPALLIVAGWQTWLIARPNPPELDRLRKEVAEDACWRAVKAMPVPDHPGKAVVLRLVNDKTGFVTAKLREAMDRQGDYVLVDPTFFDRLLKELRIEEKEVGSFDEALRAGDRIGARYVFFGEVERHTSDQHTAYIKLDLRGLDTKAGRVFFNDSVEVKPTPLEAKTRSVSVGARVLGWTLFSGLLPLGFASVTKRVLGMESNAATLVLLLCFTGISTLAALTLMGFSVDSLKDTATLLGATGTGGAYNYWLAGKVNELA